MKATSYHNSPTKVDPKQTSDNKVPNPTFTCESNIPTQLRPSLINKTHNKLKEFHNKTYENFIAEQYKPEIPNFHTTLILKDSFFLTNLPIGKWKLVAS
jgi:hypothetical protein